MTELEIIRNNVMTLYEKNPNIHIDILSHNKSVIKKAPAKIVGVYPHIFRVEVEKCENREVYTFQYTDILIRHAVIAEIDGGN